MTLAPVFTDHMVLQQEKVLPVWGTAPARGEITVTLGSVAVAAFADAAGKWKVALPAQRTNSYPQTLAVLLNGVEKISLTDILIGEVWLCAGQSNMEFRCSQESSWAAEQSTANRPLLRLCNLGYAGQGISAAAYSAAIIARQTPDAFYNAPSWTSSTAASAAPFSAVGYFFGREIQSLQNVPVGLINMAVGGSPAESWTSRAALETEPTLASMTATDWIHNNAALEPWCNGRALVQLAELLSSAPGDDLGPHHSFKPGFLWSAGPARLAPFPIRGVIWYQGESNALSHLGEADVPDPAWRVKQHQKLFPILVKDWRRHWGQGDFPFLTCQLSSISESSYDSHFWPEFRDQQRRFTSELPNVGLAVTSDIGNASNVHPTNKRDVGKRLAAWALRHVYGRETVLPCPMATTATRSGGTVTVRFQDSGQTLATNSGASPTTFELAGTDGVFHPAEAIIKSDSVQVTSTDVPTPTQVRYAWQPYSTGNLTNSAGLPASTFLLAISP